MHLSTLQRPDAYARLERTYREWSELALNATAWDQTFEHASGTYPTAEFTAGFRSFTERLDRATSYAWGSELGSPLHQVGQSLKFHGVPVSTMWALDWKTTHHESFKVSDRETWPSILDNAVAQLRRGERILRAQLDAYVPYVPPTPNPGVPSGTPSYPGTPTPTPLP